MAAWLTELVSTNLYAQRTRQASLSAEKLAASAAPFFERADLAGAASLLSAAAIEAEGRLQLIDLSGKVQLDTFALTEGTRTASPEAASVLRGDSTYAFAIRTTDGEDAAAYCAKQEVRLYSRTHGLYKGWKFSIIEC